MRYLADRGKALLTVAGQDSDMEKMGTKREEGKEAKEAQVPRTQLQ